MRVLEFFSNLPAALQVTGAVTGVLGGGTGAIFLNAVINPSDHKPEYQFENTVDKDIMPEGYIEIVNDDPYKQEAVKLVKELNKPKVIEGVKVAMNTPANDPKDTFVPIEKKKQPSLNIKKAELNKKKETNPKTEPVAKLQPIVTQENYKITIHEEGIRDAEAEALRAFNARAFGFSEKNPGRIKSGRKISALQSKQQSRGDQNKTKYWPGKKDSNTYPTDLSRVITKEKFIKAITINRIVSSLRGRVLLMVSENVYGAQGNLVLIPKGSRGSGFYNPVQKIGDERIDIYIERIVTEDGQLIVFRDPGIAGDQQGSAGVTGEIDHKYAKKFGLPLVFSFANNLANFGVMKALEAAEGTKNDEDAPTIASELFDNEWKKNQSATNQQIVSEIIKGNINITETITIPKATEITVYLNNDVWFRPNLNGRVIEAVRLDSLQQ